MTEVFFFCGQTTLTIFCCLLFPVGVLFTNRAFEELVLGLSWRGNPELDGVGGICQSRVRIKSDRNAYSFNALFISLKSLQEMRIPLRMGVLNLGRCKMQKKLPQLLKYAHYFASSIYYVVPFFVHFTLTLLELVHELMHSFGAKHDPDPTSEPECTPQDKVRKLRQI